MSQTRRTMGHYEVDRELGEGGMGVVRVGRQPELERPVVLKTLRRALADDEAVAERFLREARTAAAVHHQNVVAVYDCFTWRNERVIVQEYVEGVDLKTALATAGRVSPRIAGLLALEVVRGLEEIHALGIVHRDLKPSNILLSKRGAAKVADFGIALGDEGPGLTQTGYAVGTPPYMAPEQLLGQTADGRSDLFAMGVVLYELLAGRVPFEEGDDPGKALLRRMEARRYPSLRRLAPDTPRRMARLVVRCLQPKPRRRIASATALREGIERVVGEVAPGECRLEIAAWLWERGIFRAEEGGTVAVRPEQEPALRRRPRRWAIAAAVGALVAAAAVANWIGFESQPSWDIEALVRAGLPRITAAADAPDADREEAPRPVDVTAGLEGRDR
jgi:serine/threonine protein kinase